jgi:hypothetical protein
LAVAISKIASLLEQIDRVLSVLDALLFLKQLVQEIQSGQL